NFYTQALGCCPRCGTPLEIPTATLSTVWVHKRGGVVLPPAVPSNAGEDELQRALAQLALTEEEREILERLDVKGQPLEEVAEQLGWAPERLVERHEELWQRLGAILPVDDYANDDDTNVYDHTDADADDADNADDNDEDA